MIIKTVPVAAAAYLLGSISSSVILSRLFGGDVREKGSGNAGATNMARIYGLLAGIATFAFDALKAAVSLYIGHLVLGDNGIALAGICCLIGHCYPLYFSFKGGKGVSVGAALAFFMDWRVGVFVVVAFFLVAVLTKKVSLGSCAAAVSITVAAVIFKVSTPKLILAILGMILVIYKHRENIKRVLQGTEPNFKVPCVGIKREK